MATNALDAAGLSLGTLNELKRGFEDFLQNLRRCIARERAINFGVGGDKALVANLDTSGTSLGRS